MDKSKFLQYMNYIEKSGLKSKAKEIHDEKMPEFVYCAIIVHLDEHELQALRHTTTPPTRLPLKIKIFADEVGLTNLRAEIGGGFHRDYYVPVSPYPSVVESQALNPGSKSNRTLSNVQNCNALCIVKLDNKNLFYMPSSDSWCKYLTPELESQIKGCRVIPVKRALWGNGSWPRNIYVWDRVRDEMLDLKKDEEFLSGSWKKDDED